MKHSALPRFRGGWNALVGVPMLTPSFMYEGVHNLHHAKTRYGTSEDPEYLPLALMKPWTLPAFVVERECVLKCGNRVFIQHEECQLFISPITPLEPEF